MVNYKKINFNTFFKGLRWNIIALSHPKVRILFLASSVETDLINPFRVSKSSFHFKMLERKLDLESLKVWVKGLCHRCFRGCFIRYKIGICRKWVTVPKRLECWVTKNKKGYYGVFDISALFFIKSFVRQK